MLESSGKHQMGMSNNGQRTRKTYLHSRLIFYTILFFGRKQALPLLGLLSPVLEGEQWFARGKSPLPRLPAKLPFPHNPPYSLLDPPPDPKAPYSQTHQQILRNVHSNISPWLLRRLSDFKYNKVRNFLLLWDRNWVFYARTLVELRVGSCPARC